VGCSPVEPQTVGVQSIQRNEPFELHNRMSFGSHHNTLVRVHLIETFNPNRKLIFLRSNRDRLVELAVDASQDLQVGFQHPRNPGIAFFEDAGEVCEQDRPLSLIGAKMGGAQEYDASCTLHKFADILLAVVFGGKESLERQLVREWFR